jgi:amino acid transporter
VSFLNPPPGTVPHGPPAGPDPSTPNGREAQNVIGPKYELDEPAFTKGAAVIEEPESAPIERSGVESSQSRLEGLGYQQELHRTLRVPGVVGIAMSNVSPTLAVLLLSSGVFVVGGSFAIGANLILAVVVMMIALCLAELAAVYPLAGGIYSLVRNVLPEPISWITMFNFLMQGIAVPASIALGIPGFIKDIFPSFPSTSVVALILLLIAAGIALLTVKTGAWVMGVMVVIELTVLTIVTVGALLHPHQSLTNLTFHPQVLSGGHLVVVGGAVILATLAPAFTVINGYDAALSFSEELEGNSRAVAKAVIISAALSCILIIVPLVAGMVAAPSLNAFFKAPNPVVYSVQAALGSNARYLVDVGAAIALFNGMLALLMYFGRVLYSTGRDGAWPRIISEAFGSLNRFRAPAVGVLTLTVASGILIFTSALNFLIIFSGTVIAAVYLAIGLAAFWSRISQAGIERPYRMPVWPVAPVIVVGFTALALAKQESKYLLAECVLCAVALLAWLGSRFVWGQQRDVARPEDGAAPDIRVGL